VVTGESVGMTAFVADMGRNVQQGLVRC
jgi:hypothetical protein